MSQVILGNEQTTTVAFAKVHSCVVFLLVSTPSDADWSSYISFLKANLVPGASVGCLAVIGSGGAPTPTQRTQLNEVLAPFSGSLRSAVITDSMIHRGVVTALGWFHQSAFKAFEPSREHDALTFLGISPSAASDVRVTLAGLRARLAGRQGGLGAKKTAASTSGARPLGGSKD